MSLPQNRVLVHMTELSDLARLSAQTAGAGTDGRVGNETTSMRNDPGFHATLAFVERAAETIRTLQRESDAAKRQLDALRDQLQRERRDRQADSEKFDELVRGWHDQANAASERESDAKALAVAAIRRCEELAASEAHLLQRLERAEARAIEAQDCLSGLQKAIEFEFSNILP